MTDKEEFNFEEEEELPAGEEEPVTSAEGEDVVWAEEEQLQETLSASAAKEKKGSPARLLLLVLLFVVLGAAGLYFFLGMPEPQAPPPTPAVVKKQPIAVPAPPVREALPVAPAEPQAEKKVVEEVIPEEKPAAVVPPPPAEVSAPVAVPAGKYTLRAGAFLIKSNLAAAEEKARQLGFAPRVVQGEKAVTMTRLRVGAFSPSEGKAKVQALAPLAPDAFYLKQGEEVVVYAASYYDLDKARRFADRLYEQGIRVEEEAAQAGVPLFLLSFGDFPDLASAREAAARAEAAGLEVYVAKNR